MKDYVSQTISAYDASIAKYEEKTLDLMPSVEFKWFTQNIRGEQVLDAGCAFGRDSAEFAKRGFKTRGIDLSSGFIKRANQLHPEIDFTLGDVRELPYLGNEFSGIWCNATLLHLKDEDIELALKEFNRVLKSGGILFLSFKKGNFAGSLTEYHTVNYGRFYNNKTIETIEPMLKSAGFEVKRWNYSNENILKPKESKARDLVWLNVHSRKVDL